ncbi:hypothetical protein [Paenibacillus silvae]|uniref:Uncharacterized protein n=1 Tax=Paenibacillus silvae TaxID=1325358 RepID=A0A2W6PGZ5_9BACL|nr:hypothetical protein [Paenibacillus silvae]PZT57446.1 hypothetical protein DN757_01975 [Paenibacillus silvae]
MHNSKEFKRRFDIKQRLLEESGAFLTSENLSRLEAAFGENGNLDRTTVENIIDEILTEQNELFS